MSLNVYKIVHIVSMIFIFMSLGGISYYVMNDGTKAKANWRRGIAISHGLGMFGVLVGGFGMLARMHMSFPFATWVWIKIAVWLLLGGAIAASWRWSAATKLLWFLMPALGGIAVYSAVFKPF